VKLSQKIEHSALVPPSMPASQEFFCQRLDGELVDFYQTVPAVKLCGATEVIRATVRPAIEGETPSHWGWFDHEDGKFAMIWNSKAILSMCFPDGIEAEEKRGRGKAVPLVAEVLTKDS